MNLSYLKYTKNLASVCPKVSRVSLTTPLSANSTYNHFKDKQRGLNQSKFQDHPTTRREPSAYRVKGNEISHETPPFTPASRTGPDGAIHC